MVKMKRVLLLILISISIYSNHVYAQSMDDPVPYFTYSKGFGVQAPDSLFSMNIRFRIQNRIAGTTRTSEDFHIEEWEAVVRRLRLRLDGFVYSPKITYVLQLSFARGDLDFENTNFPNIIRDAMVVYRVNKLFAVGMGQSKLPGNRQRIVSSGDLQFADRSMANALFNIDRDFGIQFYHEYRLAKNFPYTIRTAISSGDGRNVSRTNEGLAYGGRVELFPLGAFKGNADFYEGDLSRHTKPKISIAGFYSYNDRAVRNGGTLGRPLFGERSFHNYGFDVLMKYNGWAASSEFIKREANSPLTINPINNAEVSYIYNGYGWNNELSYVFKTNWSIAGRYTMVRPLGVIKENKLEIPFNYYTLGLSRYVKGHRLKLQTDITYRNALSGSLEERSKASDFQFRFQVEIGI